MSLIFVGCHTEFAYSRCGQTRALKSFLNISSSIWMNDLHINPIILLALLIFSYMWLSNLSCSSTMTPISFSCLTCFSVLSFILYVLGCSPLSISPVFFHWLAMGLQLTTPLKLYFRSCCLQCLSSLLSNIFRLGASTIFDGRLFHPFTILMLRKFCLGDFSALWWKILKMCPLVGCC